MGLPANTRIWIAVGVTDLRRGFDGLNTHLAIRSDPGGAQALQNRSRRSRHALNKDDSNIVVGIAPSFIATR